MAVAWLMMPVIPSCTQRTMRLLRSGSVALGFWSLETRRDRYILATGPADGWKLPTAIRIPNFIAKDVSRALYLEKVLQ